MYRPTTIILPIALMAFAVVSFLLFVDLSVFPGAKNQNTNQVACSRDAKLCPDGSSVGRTGANCEFAACPKAKTKAVAKDGCVVTGCSSHVCSDQAEVTDCAYTEAYACYQSATCEKQADGACNWTLTEELKACLISPSTAASGTRLANERQTVTPDQAVAQAGEYDGQEICISGNYRQSFEYSVFVGQVHVGPTGFKTVDRPDIWVNASIPETDLECAVTDGGQTTCSGEVSVCGKFSFADESEPGLGHVGAYRYMLEATVIDPAE